jgi:hypothetical protein
MSLKLWAPFGTEERLMSLATVHYLSMNVRDGRLVFPESPTETISGTYTFSSLPASTAHTIFWGDTTNTAVTTDADGSVSSAKTYAVAGDYTITVTNAAGKVVVGEVVTVAHRGGTIVAANPPVTSAQSETFTGSGFALSTAMVIHWGDTTTTNITTSGTGTFSQAKTYADPGEYTITVVHAGYVETSLDITVV